MRYLGNKENLLEEIEAMLRSHQIFDNNLVFFDAFCGMGSVSNRFKSRFRLVCNDILRCCTTYTKGRLVANSCDFKKLPYSPFEYLNSASAIKKGFFYENYSPGGSDRMYFSAENAARIDFIRGKIQEWEDADLLNENERAYLLACLLESVSAVANTAGVYGAFLKHWDSRSLKPLRLEPIQTGELPATFSPIFHNDRIENIISDVDCDILYLDPPYTQNQYGTQYHLLETLIINDRPHLSAVTGSRPVTPYKSGWSQDLKVHILFDEIISKTKAHHIILSYSDDGFMSKDFIEATMKRYGDENSFECREIKYKEYENVKSGKNANHKEFLFYISKPDNFSSIVESPLNYTGSKAKLVNEIINILPDGFDTFIDAFGGGFNVGINIQANMVVYNDINPFVTQLISSFKDIDTVKFLRKINKIISTYKLAVGEKEPYYALREHYNSVLWKKRDPVELYALILFGFQQQIRFNTSYEFNNPIGSRYFNDKLLSKFISFSRNIKEKNVVFYSENFISLRHLINSHNLFYFDPPYFNTTSVYNDGKRGFEGWTKGHERALCDFIDSINSSGGKFILSYSIKVNGIVNTDIQNWANNAGYTIMDIVEPQGRYHDRNEVLIINY